MWKHRQNVTSEIKVLGHPVDVHEIDLETVARAADLLA